MANISINMFAAKERMFMIDLTLNQDLAAVSTLGWDW